MNQYLRTILATWTLGVSLGPWTTASAEPANGPASAPPRSDDVDRLGFRSVGAPRKIATPSGCELVLTDAYQLTLNDLVDLHVTIKTRKEGDGLTAFDARMPTHKHGMTVSPKIISDASGRNARIAGVKFHMRGYWELTFRIRCGGIEELAHATCHSEDDDARRPFRCH